MYFHRTSAVAVLLVVFTTSIPQTGTLPLPISLPETVMLKMFLNGTGKFTVCDSGINPHCFYPLPATINEAG